MKKYNLWWKRGVSAALTMVMAAGIMPTSVKANTVSEVSVKKESVKKTAADNLLASFDFNQEASDGENGKFFLGEGSKAAVNGSCQIQIREAENKALYLDGGSNYLNITAQDDSPLLTGKEEITISYDAKPDRTGANWAFFASNSTASQNNNQERYIGSLVKDGNTKIERYKNSGSRPKTVSASTGNDWSHVDVVFTRTETKLYVNGRPAVTAESQYLLSDILGENSVFQIGKANWGNGEYYKGWIDNFKIYDGALTDGELVDHSALDQEEYDALTIYGADNANVVENIKGNINLPAKGKYGSAVTWKSSDEAVITSSKTGDKPAGVVTRPQAGQGDKNITLTATINGKDKVFTAKVKELPAGLDTNYESEDGGYLWVNFGISGKYEKIFYGFSEDGLNWYNLNKNAQGTAQPILDNTESDLGVRDPHIIRSPQGDKYWILGTDLHAEGGGTGGTGWNSHGGSKKLIVWESDDMVNWKKSIVDAGLETAGCVWAPEAIYDEKTGEYMVYWSARDEKYHGTQEGDPLKVYLTRTRDFHTFTEPKVWLSEDGGADNYNIIDSTIQKMGDSYFRFSTSDWNTVVEKSAALSDEVYDVTKDNSANPWQRIMTRSTNVQHGIDGKEGLNSYKLPNGQWCVVGDNQGYDGYLFDTQKVQFKKISNMKFHDGRFRHGSIIRVSKAEKDAILQAYDKNNKYNPAAKEDPQLVSSTVTVKNGTGSDFTGATGDVAEITADSPEEGKVFAGWSFKTSGGKDYNPVFADNTNKNSETAKIYLTSTSITATAQYTAVEEPVIGKPAEDHDGLTVASGAELIDDFASGKMLKVTAGWNNTNGGHADFKGSQKLFRRNSFTLLADIKVTDTDNAGDNQKKKSAFAVGTETNSIRIQPQLGILGYGGHTSGIPSQKAAMTKSMKTNKWSSVALVYHEDAESGYAAVYMDGEKVSDDQKLGFKLSTMDGVKGSVARSFGTSFLLNGIYDNIVVSDQTMTEENAKTETAERTKQKRQNAFDKEVQVEKAYIGTYPTPPGSSEDPDNTPDASKGKDDHTAVSAKVDSENKKITSYVQPEADLSELEVNITLADSDAKLKIDGKEFVNGGKADLSNGAALEVSLDGAVQTWQIEKPKIAYNPVLPGQFADPDIDYFDGKYWMSATTDGYGGKDGRWTSYDFHMFSSDDMVNWKDEGVILDVKNKTPGKNEKGVDIAPVEWSQGNAWAPSIEKVGDKYYFYFCAKKNGTSCIGVAVADKPAGPYTAMKDPLLTPEICNKAGASVGQTIDPSIFKDTDGKTYIYFGNGSGAVAQLNDDMVSIKEGTMKKISGMNGFRESVVVNKIGSKYHFTWSCNDAGSENYSVNYGTSDSPYGPVDFKYTLLQKDKENDMLGTGHQSMLEDPKTGKLYLSYHRFFTPLGVYTSDRYFGIHRESCINQVPYDEESGLMLAIKPTMEGVKGNIVLADGSIYKGDGAKKYVTVNYQASKGGQITGTPSQKIDKDGETMEVEAVAEKGYRFVQWNDGKKEAKRSDQHVQSDITYTAQFEKTAEPVKKVTVRYAANTGGRIEGNTVQQINAGESASTVKAVPNKGYRFVRWSDGLTSASRTDKNVRADQTIAAYFEKIAVKPPVVKPAAVTGLKSYSNKTTSLKISWKKVKDAKGYEVYRYSSKYKKYVKVKTTGSTSYYNNKLKAGTTYSYRVRAYKYNGKAKLYGSFSRTLKTATAPSKVTGVKVKKSSKTKIKLSWKKTKGASGYAIYMKTGNGKYKRVKTITKGSTARYSKTKLKKGRKYTFKIRAYKKADKNIYGSYSSSKTLKLK